MLTALAEFLFIGPDANTPRAPLDRRQCMHTVLYENVEIMLRGVYIMRTQQPHEGSMQYTNSMDQSK